MVILASLAYGVLLLTLGANLLYLRRHRRSLKTPDRLPFVPIVIPARNEEHNIGRLLSSLLAQDYPVFEAIVYDDGSEDGTSEVVRSFRNDRITLLRGEGPPPGWVGKVHALFEATRILQGELVLFLDADAELRQPSALRDLVRSYVSLPQDSVLTGLTRLEGGGALLVSVVPNAVLIGLPWPLVRRLRHPLLAALNGQCWMMNTEAYRRLEPHREVADAVLEDVEIGRYLKQQGLTPQLVDVQREVSIHMYPDFRSAWHGFRKNAYLLTGGRPLPFLAFFTVYCFVYIVTPLMTPWFGLPLYLLKGVTDRVTRFPLSITFLAPISFFLGAVLQLDSAYSHLTGRASWKGRPVGVRKVPL